MTAKIKLNAASGGGSFSLQAPSSSSNNRVMTLPDTADGTILTTTKSRQSNVIQTKHLIKKDVASRQTSGYNFGTLWSSPTITVTETGSKILVTSVGFYASNNQTGRYGLRLKRRVGGNDSYPTFDSVTAISVGLGNRQQAFGGYRQNSNDDFAPIGLQVVDEHGQSAGTSIQYIIESSGEQSDTIYLNRPSDYQDSVSRYNCVSTITLMELAP